MIEFEYGEARYTGDRDHQEDTCRFLQLRAPTTVRNNAEGGQAASALVAVLADGMGGEVAGELASQTACQTFLDAFLNGDDGQSAQSSEQDRLKTALLASNSSIATHVHNNADLQGMGCTLVGVRFGRRGMRWISVGDSPLYLFRDGKVEQRNEDHSLAPTLEDLVRRGEMSREDADNHPQRHALKSAIMGSTIQLIDQRQDFVPLMQGDWVVLASDGLQTLSEAEIEATIEHAQSGGARAVAESLVAAVRDKRMHYQDNTTVMAIAPYEVADDTSQRPPASSLRMSRRAGKSRPSSKLPVLAAVVLLAAFLLFLVIKISSGSI